MLCQYLSGVLPVFFLDPALGSYRKNPSAPDRTFYFLTFYRRDHSQVQMRKGGCREIGREDSEGRERGRQGVVEGPSKQRREGRRGR